MIKIDASNSILVDGKDTGLKFAQRQSGTVVYTPESRLHGTAYKEHAMPHQRYSAAHDAPASGAAGRAQLEADVLALLKQIGAS